jgi:hypothetical protein
MPSMVSYSRRLQSGGVEVWRGGLGSAYRFPTLSSAGASLAEPCFRFHTPLIEPGQAQLTHPALGERLTVSPTESCWSAG